MVGIGGTARLDVHQKNRATRRGDMEKPTPIRPTNDEARALGRLLIDQAAFAALAVLQPETGAPMVSRIAFATDQNGVPLTLISDLSHHTVALKSAAICSLLVGEPGDKGDPLTHPRITLQADAHFVERASDDHADLRARYLDLHPKARLYIDFADFRFVRFAVSTAYLNGGFGKAFVLTPADLEL